MRALLAVTLLVVAGCSTPEPSRGAAKRAYPDAWFAPLPPGVEPHSWEITPDRAKPGEVILSKRTELGVFSNFAATPFTLEGRRFASLEGLWQSLWYPEGAGDPRAAWGEWPRTRQEVEQLTAFDAKRAGDDARKIAAAAGTKGFMSWNGHRFDPKGTPEERAFHLDLIERATRAKVEQNPRVKELLLATGDLVLRPDHDQGKDPTPAYFYFEILTRIRADLSR